MAELTHQVVIGLAGHIDHGKTALVQALTGVNTDSQVEEQRRGMTIDIGFAFLTPNITLVDVPGHDRLVKNMVRGAAGIQMGLLVVAADDGVMPQTREHFHILQQLGISRLIVAITKADLVDDDWVALVKDDVTSLLADTALQGARLITASGVTGVGVEELTAALIEAATDLPAPVDRGFFRLSVDRLFTVKGFGAVVTGSVTSGHYEAGEPLEAVPTGRSVKIRGMQTHGTETGHISLGDRAALNIGNLSAKELERGQQLATPGFVATPATALAHINLLADAAALKHNHPVRINIGTAEVMARIKLLNTRKMQPGDDGLVVLDLAAPTAMIMGDAFVLRSFSPVKTIGGGTVVDVVLPEKWKEQKLWAAALANLDVPQRLKMIIQSAAAKPFTFERLAHRFAYAEAKLSTMLDDSIERIGAEANPWIVTRQQFSDVQEAIVDALKRHHAKQLHSSGINREALRQLLNGDDKYIDYLLREMATSGKLQVVNDLWALADHAVTLSDAESSLMGEMIAMAKRQGYAPDYIDDWASSLKMSEDIAGTLVAIAEAEGTLVRISPRLMFHRETVNRLLDDVQRYFRANADLTVADLKALTGTSRKMAVPILEYLDRSGHTIRIGDKRVAPDA